MVLQRAHTEEQEEVGCPGDLFRSRRSCRAAPPHLNLHGLIRLKLVAAISPRQSRKTDPCIPLAALQRVAYLLETTSNRLDRCEIARLVDHLSLQHWFSSFLGHWIAGSRLLMQTILRKEKVYVRLSEPRAWVDEMCFVDSPSSATQPQVQQIQYFPDVS
jgi:hypothetical protein